MKLLRALLFIILSASCLYSSQDAGESFQNITLISVYDGDTFKVSLDCKYSVLCSDISVRVKDIDTPEIRTKNKCEKERGEKAKAFTEDLLSRGEIVLSSCGRDKYFRLLCDVYIAGEKGVYNLADELLASGLAKKYNGGKKAEYNWCSAK
ncbi:nuclease-like protein [Parelusimicrobium proximum]|uniref:thermonuclease family protein n=1 Tax=Parelusimicrobium proximum TaxID=3228953 RepID=UPI003D16F9D8